MRRKLNTRTDAIGGAIAVEEAKNWSTATRGGMYADDEPCVMLDNLSSSAGIRVAYVYDIGTGNDWKLAVTYIPIGQQKIACSYHDFNLAGAELGTFSTPNLTATCTAATYEVLRIWVSAANTLTLTNATFINADDRATSTTVSPVVVGENSFLIKIAAGQTALTAALTTADSSGQGSVYEITELDRNELARIY